MCFCSRISNDRCSPKVQLFCNFKAPTLFSSLSLSGSYLSAPVSSINDIPLKGLHFFLSGFIKIKLSLFSIHSIIEVASHQSLMVSKGICPINSSSVDSLRPFLDCNLPAVSPPFRRSKDNTHVISISLKVSPKSITHNQCIF